MISERKAGLDNVVTAGVSLVSNYANDVTTGKLAVDVAKREALRRLNSMRYSARGYITVVDSGPVVVMSPNPGKNDQVGMNVGTFTDSDGKPFYRDLVDIGHREGGGLRPLQVVARGSNGSCTQTGLRPILSRVGLVSLLRRYYAGRG